MKFDFSEYIKDNWNYRQFCHALAEEARNAILEMAQGTQKIADPKLQILHNEDDYKFLSQFPYDVWPQALNWRYNLGLRELMRMSKGRTHIPEGLDWMDEVKFPVSASRIYRFRKHKGRPIYVGLTSLAKRLTKPAKGHEGIITRDPDNPELPHPHWEEGGTALADINPYETDENSPSHPKNYKHGYYDLDLSDMAEVTDDDIDKIPATDIHAMLGPPLSQMGIKMPEVEKAIDRIRAKMKKVKKHSFSAYDVPQIGTSQDNVSDWLTANAVGLYGNTKVGDEHYDELTGNTHVIGEKTPTQMNALYKQAFKKKKGGQEGEDFTLRHNVATIDKPMTYDEIDKEGNVLDTHVEKMTTIPYLNAQKGIPQLHKAEGSMKITPEQRLKIAQFRAKENPTVWDAGEWTLTPGEKLKEAIVRWGHRFTEASKIDTFKNFLKFWDIWTPEQKAWLKKNAKSLMETAKKVHTQHGKEDVKAQIDAYKSRMERGEELSPSEMAHLDSLEKEQLSKPQYQYAAGPRPNYKSIGQGVLDIPKDKMLAFKEKYLPMLQAELKGHEGMVEQIL